MNPLFDTIADGLAEHGYAVADQVRSQSEEGTILSRESLRAGTTASKKAGIGKQQDHQINEGIRGDYIQWIDKHTASEAVSVYLRRIEQLMQHINRTLYLSMKDYEIHMTVYPVGSYYRRHLDQFKKDDHRKLSVICYLNEGWKEEHGGQLRIYRTDGPLDILPVAGRLVCFRSDQLEHEVLPATRERLSLTGWILDQYADVKHL